MIEYKNGKWELCKLVLSITEHGVPREVKVVDASWWIDFASKWEHLKIVSTTDLEVTEEQKLRYENIKDMPEDFGDIYSQYVEFGTIADHAHLLVSHPFVALVTRLTEISNHQKIEELRVEMARSNTELFELVLSIGGSPGV